MNGNLYLLTSQCADFFWKCDSNEGAQEKSLQMLGMEHTIQKWTALESQLWVSHSTWLALRRIHTAMLWWKLVRSF